MTHELLFRQENDTTYFFFHPRVDHDIAALHAFWPTLETLVDPLRYDYLDLLFVSTFGQTFAHELLYLLCLLALSQVACVCDAFSFLQSLFNTLSSLHLFPRLGFSYFFDRSGVQSALFGTQGLDSLLRNGDVGKKMFCFIVQKPLWEIIFRIEGVTRETVVDEFRSRFSSVHKILGEGHCFCCEEAVLWSNTSQSHNYGGPDPRIQYFVRGTISSRPRFRCWRPTSRHRLILRVQLRDRYVSPSRKHPTSDSA